MKNQEQRSLGALPGSKFICLLFAAGLLAGCGSNPRFDALQEVACGGSQIEDNFLVCIVFESTGNECPEKALFEGSKDKSPLIKNNSRRIVWQAVREDSSSNTGYTTLPVLFKVASNPFSGNPTRVVNINQPDGTAISQPLGNKCDSYTGACISDPGNGRTRPKQEVVYKYSVQKYLRSGPGQAEVDVNCAPLDPVFRVMM